MKIHDLRMELSARGGRTAGLKKPQLEKSFNEMRTGIANVPALLQPNPRKYELVPTEPMHDLKGHFSNAIEESVHVSKGND